MLLNGCAASTFPVEFALVNARTSSLFRTIATGPSNIMILGRLKLRSIAALDESAMSLSGHAGS